MTSTILDKARGVAQQAVAGAQDALSAAQHKLDELSRASQLDDKLATLGAAFYAEQRSGGDRGDVDAALQEVDAHVLAYGWTRDTSPVAYEPGSDIDDADDTDDVDETEVDEL